MCPKELRDGTPADAGPLMSAAAPLTILKTWQAVIQVSMNRQTDRQRGMPIVSEMIQCEEERGF